MGIDLLDIVFRIERRWGIHLPDEALQKAGSRPGGWDITSGQLMELIYANTRLCGHCRYDLRGHGPQGRCPECGKLFTIPADRQECWRDLQQILSEALRVKPEDVKPESWLIRDLGCT